MEEEQATLDLPDAEREARLVMTTAHENERADDAAFFFVHNTNFGGHAFRDYLVLVIGTDEAATQHLTDAVHAQAAGASGMV